LLGFLYHWYFLLIDSRHQCIIFRKIELLD